MATQLTLPPDARARQGMLGKLHDRVNDKVQSRAGTATKTPVTTPRVEEKIKS